jgi:hypothetical protein
MSTCVEGGAACANVARAIGIRTARNNVLVIIVAFGFDLFF